MLTPTQVDRYKQPPLNIESNKSLRFYNSFGFDINAEHFISVQSTESLAEALEWSKQHRHPVFVLGGGSNCVFTRNVTGVVIHIAIPGFDLPSVPSSGHATVTIKAGAGVNWHQLVIETLNRNLFGLENLALIPGCAGAAPIQNIGAYGTEISDLLTSVDAFNSKSGEQLTLSASECDFGYRHSLFKTPAGDNLIVTAINLKLSRDDLPNIQYKALQETLESRGIEKPGCQQVFDTVCEIRQAKLPDPARLGNAGSFFKNPVINRQQLDAILNINEKIPHFQQSDNNFKVPAAWLIDQAGWKGHRSGLVGVHKAQALVLVNHGGGNGQQIAILAEQIKKDILQRFGVTLEREPVLY